jgi:uncharacterized membrane protein HdeD (DUF308 family)
VKRDVPLSVQRWRAAFGVLLSLVALVIVARAALSPVHGKTEYTDYAFGALLLVFGVSRIVGYVRARRLRA